MDASVGSRFRGLDPGAHPPERALPQDRVPQIILPVYRDGGDWLMADDEQPSQDSQDTLPTVIVSPEPVLSSP